MEIFFNTNFYDICRGYKNIWDFFYLKIKTLYKLINTKNILNYKIFYEFCNGTLLF